MQFNRVLLIRLPYYGTFLGDASSLPVGLGYIAEALYDNKIEYDVFDMGLTGNTKRVLFEKVNKFKPDLLGITMMTMHYKAHYQLINELKERFPSVKIAVGGPHLSTFREQVLSDCKSIDYGVVLEGDELFIELCKGEELSAISGLIYRNNEKIIFNGNRPFIGNLDKISFPRYRKFELERYLAPSVPIHTTRGCPYECIYCPVSLAIGKKFRARSPEHIMEEIGYWYARGKREFLAWDDNFTLIQDRVFNICDLIEQHGFKDLSIGIPNGIRADKASYELLKRMREVGFGMLSFGVEAGNDRILSNIKKGTNIKSMERAVKDACDLGYDVFLYFIIGSPGETWSDFQESLDFAKKYPAAEARFYTLIPFPHTELFDWAEENNYLIRQPEEYLNTADHFVNKPCLSTPEMSAAERIKAFKTGWKLSNEFRVKLKMKNLGRFGIFKRAVSMFLISNTYRQLYRNKWFRYLVVVPFRKLKSPS